MTTAAENDLPPPLATASETAPETAPGIAPRQDPPAEVASDFAPLTTERLMLRPLHAHDAANLHRLINDWEVTRTLAELPYPYPRELADEWIASTRRRLADGTAYHLAITGHEGEQETLVGVVGLTLNQANRTGRLGYWVGRDYWKHGVATEAAGRLTRWGFANLSVDRIAAEVAEGNEASCAVLRRIGFVQTGTAVRRSKTSEQDCPMLVFQATRDDVFGRPEMPAVAAAVVMANAVQAAAGADTGSPTGSALPAATGGAPHFTAAATAQPNGTPLLLVAACALVDLDGRVLLARRPEGKKMAGLWEFPGGKLHPGETPEAALIRELKEEIGVDVTAACLAPFAFASHAYAGFHLLMPLYICRRWKGIPIPRENQTLTWVRAAKLTEYEMPPADKPLIPLLRDFL